jgi:hypothetical protein
MAVSSQILAFNRSEVGVCASLRWWFKCKSRNGGVPFAAMDASFSLPYDLIIAKRTG